MTQWKNNISPMQWKSDIIPHFLRRSSKYKSNAAEWKNDISPNFMDSCNSSTGSLKCVHPVKKKLNV